MTDRYRYVLDLQSPHSAARTSEKGNHVSVHAVLPGSVVRGAFAAVWWAAHGKVPAASQVFAALFDESLRVGQAIPDGADLRGASEWFCKYESKPTCEEFRVDDAVLAAKGRTAAHACTCGGPAKQSAGWYQPQLNRLRLTATQLSPDEKPESGLLYSREVIAAADKKGHPTRYTGELGVPPGEDPNWLHNTVIQVGGKRSLSLGLARVSIEDLPKTEAGAPDPAVLRLTSPTILLDEFGAPSLAEQALEAEIGRVSGDPIQIVHAGGRPGSWIRSELVTGWHMRSALPKPAEWAIAPGSTAVISGLTPDGARRLAAGIGYRTLEGFGAVDVIDPAATPDPPAPIGGERARSLLRFVAERQRGQTRAEVRRELNAMLAAVRSGADPSAAAAAAMTRPMARQLLGAGQAALRNLYALRTQADIEDALEALK